MCGGARFCRAAESPAAGARKSLSRFIDVQIVNRTGTAPPRPRGHANTVRHAHVGGPPWAWHPVRLHS
jgi:hypothetical protein